MKHRREPALTISEQAAQWLVVLMEADAAKTSAFVEWLKQSPQHVEEFLFATATWQQLCEFRNNLPIDLDAILAEVRASAASNVVALPSTPRPTQAADQETPAYSSHFAEKRLRRVQWAAGIAALGLMTLFGWSALTGGSAYATDIGEQRTVRLNDGSVMYLNTETRVRVRFTADHRDIELLEGEALFTVAHNSARPFRVHTHDSVVQAVGTQFNVRRYVRDTRVAVVEGRVKLFHQAAVLTDLSQSAPRDGTAHASLQTHAAPPLSPPEVATTLGAGEGATIADDGQINKRKDIDIAQTVAWRERRLVFRADRLEDVATELNRYSTQRFRIEGTRAKEMRLTATFDVDKPESLVAFLQRYSNLQVDHQADEVVIRSAQGEQSISSATSARAVSGI